MIKAIAFDYGGVIEKIEKGLMQKIADFLKVPKSEWMKAYFSYNHLCNTGKNTYEEVYAFAANEFGASDEQIAQIHQMMKENRETRKIDLELIEKIKELKKNYKIGLLSNNYTALRQELIDEKIIDIFDAVIISAEVGFYKPQPEIFEILFKKLGVKNSEVIFIDDTKQSLIGAEAVGYIPVLFRNNDLLFEDLQKLGVKI